MSSGRLATWRCFLLTAISLLVLAPVHRVSAEDLRATTSLKFTPADVSFYASLLRNKEQLDVFLASNTYTKLRNLPLLSFGLSVAEGQWANPTNEHLQKFKEVWQLEENQQLKDVLLDAVSNEVFVYGDTNFTALLKLGQDLQRTMRSAQLPGNQSDEAAQEKIIAEYLDKLSEFKIPGMVIGFKLSNQQAAQSQIDRLEKLLADVFTQNEQLKSLKDRLKRETIGEGSFLNLDLDGSLIPWDELPEDAREKLGEKGRDAIAKLKLTISVGIRDGYLLFATGTSIDKLKEIGQGKLLIDRPEMAAIREHADQRIVSIGFTSREFMQQANYAAAQINDLVTNVEAMLPAAGLDEEFTKAIVKDVEEFGREVQQFIPRPGATASFNFMTDTGYEGYEYSWTEASLIDSSQKLSILNHVGGEPIGFVASRGVHRPDGYDFLTKWIGRAWKHVDAVIAAKFNAEERQKFEQIRDRILPLVKRLNDVTRNNLIPALKDGQAALVLDGKARSKQWHNQLPSTRVDLPMLELAIVCGVSDPVALKRAGSEYFAIVQEALNIAHELSDDQFPKIELPKPKQSNSDVGDLYSYDLPQQAGLDRQLEPNVGLSKDFLVFSLFPEHTKRLLKETQPKSVGPLNPSDKALAAASYFNVAALMDTITPWVNFAVRIAGQAQGEDNPQARMAAQMVAGNVTPILDVLKSFGECASLTYVENDVIVTHSVSVFQD
jgi:hypothetical protein